jgi:DNA mismatch endonuclease, patch repair protein
MEVGRFLTAKSMADPLTPEQRRRCMSAVRTRGTSLEKIVARVLRRAGIRYRSGPKLFGRPDFVLRDEKVTIFVDSCFWHGCSAHSSIPKTNRRFWQAKIDSNIARDREVSRMLRRLDYEVVRVWQHQLVQTARVVGRIRDAAARSKLKAKTRANRRS